MTWLITWNGREYDVDPTEFSTRELSLIKQRTTYNFHALTAAILDFDGDAIRALFWVVDLREDQNLKFSEYDGPPLKVVIPQLAGLGEALDVLIPKDPDQTETIPTTSTGGSPSSPSDSGGPEPSTAS